MEAMNGPQWEQLPLLMTHEEVGRIKSGEFNRPVSRLYGGFFSSTIGNRGDDLRHVREIQDRIRTHGYDERFPLVLRTPTYLANGNHRAAAVHNMGHPLTPVVFTQNPAEENVRQ